MIVLAGHDPVSQLVGTTVGRCGERRWQRGHADLLRRPDFPSAKHCFRHRQDVRPQQVHVQHRLVPELLPRISRVELPRRHTADDVRLRLRRQILPGQL